MFDKITFNSETKCFTPIRICLIVFLASMAFPLVFGYVGMIFAAGIMMAFEVEMSASIILEAIANVLTIMVWPLMLAGVFLLRRTTKLYAIGWLCIAAQVLCSCVLLPPVSELHGEPEFPLYLLLMYIVLFLCAAAIGVMTLIGRGNKWVMLVTSALGYGLFLVTLFAGQSCFVGTVGVVAPLDWENGFYIFDKINLISVLIANSALFASAVLVSLSHEPTYY
ncbi:MAG: hypothetical protein ACI4KM_07000 [Oscillospiraceae bacterium]